MNAKCDQSPVPAFGIVSDELHLLKEVSMKVTLVILSFGLLNKYGLKQSTLQFVTGVTSTVTDTTAYNQEG